MLRSSSSSDESSLSCSFSQLFRCSDIPCHFMNNNMYFFPLHHFHRYVCIDINAMRWLSSALLCSMRFPFYICLFVLPSISRWCIFFCSLLIFSSSSFTVPFDVFLQIVPNTFIICHHSQSKHATAHFLFCLATVWKLFLFFTSLRLYFLHLRCGLFVEYFLPPIISIESCVVHKTNTHNYSVYSHFNGKPEKKKKTKFKLTLRAHIFRISQSIAHGTRICSVILGSFFVYLHFLSFQFVLIGFNVCDSKFFNEWL